MELLNGDKLVQVMDKFTTLCSPNVRNLVAFFKHWLCIVGYIYSIFSFKAGSGYDYIQDSCFQDNSLENLFFCSRCLCMEMVVNVIW
jgi:hypothetical protein